jgi:hypothetical protein
MKFTPSETKIIMNKIILFTAATLLSANISYTCWFDDSEAHYPFFNKESLSDPTMLLFTDYSAGLGLGYSENASEPADGNIKDWLNHLEGAVSDNDLVDLIYKLEREELAKILKDDELLSSLAANNTVYKLWTTDPKKKKSMGNYLLFAKKCEVEAVKGREYWEEEGNDRNISSLKKMMEEGLTIAKKEKVEFYKQRYAFQAIRAAFYMNDNNTVLKLFNEHFPKGSKENYIYFRALEFKAGAHKRKGDAEAPYLYAKVFQNCPDRRNVCLNSFSFTSEEDWDKSISLCKNNEEKAVYYALRALQPNSNLIEELENIANIAPSSPLLEMLTARQIGKMQEMAFPRYADAAGRFPLNDIENSNELKRLKLLMKTMSENKTIKNNGFWLLAAGYSELMSRNTEDAIKIFSSIPAVSEYKKQANVMTFVAKICAVKQIDVAIADNLWNEHRSSPLLKENVDLSEFMQDAFSMFYIKQGDKARAYLTYHGLYAMRGRLDIGLLDALDFYFNSKINKGEYDRFLIEERCGSLPDALNELAELRGVYYLQRNNLDKAIAEFEKTDINYRKQSTNFNSKYLDKSIWYESVIHPYFEFELEDQSVNFLFKKYDFLYQDYNLLSYTKALKMLVEKAKSDPSKTGEYHYLLGLAWYNTGVQGWHRPAIYLSESNEGNYTWWSSDDKEEEMKLYKGYDWISDRFYTPDIAAYYFESAIKNTNDKELKAKALYQLAKVEKTRDLSQLSDSWAENLTYSKRFYECFNELKTNLSNTAYYKDVLRECYDFQVYVNQ